MLNETGADIAITNGGGIRDSIEAGDITKDSVIKVLPFGNYIVTIHVYCITQWQKMQFFFTFSLHIAGNDV